MYHTHAYDRMHQNNCRDWRYRDGPHQKIGFSNWDDNEGCEGDTCARMQGNGTVITLISADLMCFLAILCCS